MAAFYLDHDISLRLAPPLRRAGHQVTTTRDLGSSEATDAAQLLTAVQDRWVLVTYNRTDFALLRDAWRTWPAAFGLVFPPHPGILALDHAPVADQAGAVVALLDTAPAESLANEVFWWRRQRGWTRRVSASDWPPHP